MTEIRDTLGDHCKRMEFVESERRGDIGQPIYIRIDGSRFSKFTKGMDRPYDLRMSRAMVETTKAIMQDYHSLIGYTQSDEISLVFYDEEHETHHGGKYQKIVSRLASKATAAFTKIAYEIGLRTFVERQLPEFDARAFAVPSLLEAAKILRWREIDATKNAISMAARSVYSHKQLHGKNADDMLFMLLDKGTDFRTYPGFFRMGTYIRRVTEMRELSAEELERIPERHRPEGPVLRHSLVEFDPPEYTGMENYATALFKRASLESIEEAFADDDSQHGTRVA